MSDANPEDAAVYNLAVRMSRALEAIMDGPEEGEWFAALGLLIAAHTSASHDPRGAFKLAIAAATRAFEHVMATKGEST